MATNRETLERLARANLPDLEPAALKDILAREHEFTMVGDTLVQHGTLKRAQDVLTPEVWYKDFPHHQKGYVESNPEQAAIDRLTEAACYGTPTMKARAALMEKVGRPRYLEILAENNCSELHLRAGTKPPTAVDQKAAAKQIADRKSPWGVDGWSLRAQGEYVRQHGIEAAHREAARMGSKVGATRPAR
jgi:hypothetical protein